MKNKEYYQRTHGKAYTYHGKTQYLTQWSEELGIPRKILSNRLASGWGIQRAFEQPVRADMRAKIEYKGNIYSYAELSRKFGIRYEKFKYRMKHGYDIEDARHDKDYRHKDRTNVYPSIRPKLCVYPLCDNCPYEDCIA